MSAQTLRDVLPAATLLGLCARVVSPLEVSQFAFELAMAAQSCGSEQTRFDGVKHGAPRLRLVLAIGEPAPRRNLLNVCEGLTQTLVAVPQLEFAQARRVDDQAARWQ